MIICCKRSMSMNTKIGERSIIPIFGLYFRTKVKTGPRINHKNSLTVWNFPGIQDSIIKAKTIILSTLQDTMSMNIRSDKNSCIKLFNFVSYECRNIIFIIIFFIFFMSSIKFNSWIFLFFWFYMICICTKVILFWFIFCFSNKRRSC